MGLNGSLEELSLQDILQILALGQKSGQLWLDTPAGVGTIVLRAGRVVAAFDDGAPSLETSLSSWPGGRRPEVLRRRIVASLARVEGGYRVVEAGDVESAVERGASLGEAGVRFVLVADLNMPASAGDSFRGGVEVVKRLARLRLRPPVVMMADGALSSLGARPLRGAWSLVQKPGPSKLDPEEFEADLRALAGRMVEKVLPRVCGAVPA